MFPQHDVGGADAAIGSADGRQCARTNQFLDEEWGQATVGCGGFNTETTRRDAGRGAASRGNGRYSRGILFQAHRYQTFLSLVRDLSFARLICATGALLTSADSRTIC